MVARMFRIIYVSRNLVPPAEAEAEVQRILAACRRHNAACDVTGALLFTEDAFAQALEGPMAAVGEVFDRIQMDPRHDEVVVLEAGAAPARAFGEWRMAYAGRTLDASARYAALLGHGPAGAAAEGVLRLLHGVVARAEGTAWQEGGVPALA
jgi:hypothetical protein